MLANGLVVTAFSRQAPVGTSGTSRTGADRLLNGIIWRQLDQPAVTCPTPLENWICVAPIWVLPDYFDLLLAHGAKRIVALSSTSRFTKSDSRSPDEQALAKKLTSAEDRLIGWAESHGIAWTVLRPTLIYGLGQDKNVSEIVRVIRRVHCFLVFGKANGLRQPIHANDVAIACINALNAATTVNKSYNISGGETLAYSEMVRRIFVSVGKTPVLLRAPLPVFRMLIFFLRLWPRFSNWNSAMAERMNKDLVFDNLPAARDFNFQPRNFELRSEDLAQRRE